MIFFNNEMGDIISPISVKEDTIDLTIVENYIQSIITNRFSEYSKQKIEKNNNRFSIACPYCGDSSTDLHKKRGNIYYDGLGFKCYNCGKFASFKNFLYDFNDILNLQYSDIIKYNNISNSYVSKPKNLLLLDKNIINTYGVDINIVKNTYNFSDIKNTIGEKYLRNRYHYNLDDFLYDKKNNSIVIINKHNDIVFGFQIRNLKEKKYYSYSLAKIYNDVGLEINDVVIDLDDISTYFNIFNLNYNDTITVFEGPLDSFLYKNSIAISGAFNKLIFDYEDLSFCYDNDKTGKTKTIEKLKLNYKVFLWKKILTDLGISEYIKDFNDLIIYLNKNNIKNINFNKYYSNNKLDMIYV